MTNQTNLNENLNEVENTTSQTQTTTTTTQDSELKITFLGRGRTISNTVTKTIDAVSKGVPNKLNKKTAEVVLPETLVITKDGIDYSVANKNLSVNVDRGGFYATGGVDLTGGIAQYKYVINDISHCSVMQIGEKTYIFDLSHESNAATLISFLRENNITKIDGIIITHFHTDHMGTISAAGFNSLLNYIRENSDDENPLADCKFYLPHQAGKEIFDWSKLNDTTRQEAFEDFTEYIPTPIIVNGEEQENIIYPSVEGEEITIDNNTKIRFYNVDSSYFDEYYNCKKDHFHNENDQPRYNNFSMVSVIEHGNNKLVITGDIEEAAQKNVANAILGADMIQVEHHGFNQYNDMDYINNLSAKIGVISAYNYWRNNRLSQPTANKIISNGGDVYYTGDCGNVTVYSNGKKVYVDPTLKPIKTFNSMSSGVVLIGDGNEDLLTLPVGVYSFASASVLRRVANNPPLITTAGKVIVEYISANLNAKKVTVIANATSGIVATRLYRSSGGEMDWTKDWQYSYPYTP